MRDEHEDDLFAPTLAGRRRELPPPGRRPWRLGSQFYVSVFGGPVGAGLVGFLNAKRLGLPPRRLAGIAAIGVAALVAVAIVAAIVTERTEETRPLRLMTMIGGAAAYLPIRELQKHADRRYGVGREEDESYDSLWLPGVAIALGGGLVGAIVLAGVAA